jgi:hypothetical protein
MIGEHGSVETWQCLIADSSLKVWKIEFFICTLDAGSG